jgi:hypothetical protein
MATTVRNIKDGTFDPANPEHVYIGRANRRYRLAESEWHNPFPIDRQHDRNRVLASYWSYLGTDRRDLAERVGELRDKTLYCWCVPERCHGHILAELAG